MPTQQFRLDRLKDIIDEVKKKKQVPFNAIFAQFSIEYGISRRTFQDYIRTLKDAGKIEYDQFTGKITLPGGN